MDNLKFNESVFDENIINLRKFRFETSRFLGINHKSIPKEAKPLELMLGTQVNAFYYNDDNSINAMAGVLHPPTYDAAWPKSLKYGTLGFMIGHELTHSTEPHYDSDGLYRNWYSKKSDEIYKDRSKCFINHFDHYFIPEIGRYIDGEISKEENIADAVGLREALNAYRRERKTDLMEENKLKDSSDEEMPSLGLNSEQLLFLGYAQLWCSKYHESHYWEDRELEHTVNKYRVLGTVSNLDDFSIAYNCPIGSNMNANTTKCRVW